MLSLNPLAGEASGYIVSYVLLHSNPQLVLFQVSVHLYTPRVGYQGRIIGLL